MYSSIFTNKIGQNQGTKAIIQTTLTRSSNIQIIVMFPIQSKIHFITVLLTIFKDANANNFIHSTQDTLCKSIWINGPGDALLTISLIQRGLVTPYGVIKLGQHWLR